MIDALLLGMSTGLYCMTSCAPVAIPLLCTREKTSPGNTGRTALVFMTGRFIGYIVTGLILGKMGAFAVEYLNPGYTAAFSRISYAAAGILLLWNAVYAGQKKKKCPQSGMISRLNTHALLLGLATGFSLCPPFFAAASKVFGLHSSLGGAAYFALFFVGSSIYFIPMFGLAAAGTFIPHMKTISRTATFLIGTYFFLFLGVFNV